MADSTTIEWTDATWNPITGCSVCSAGCKRCYAMKLAGGRLQHHPSREGLTVATKEGPVWTGEVRFNEGWLLDPIRWKRPRAIFVCAHADLFHPGVPDEWIDRIFAVMARADWHTYQVLTKRPERMLAYCRELYACGEHGLAHLDAAEVWPFEHVLLGTSVENRDTLARIDVLRQVPARRRFLSIEPLLEELGPIDLTGIDWAILGGERGPGARPMHPDPARSIRDQCAAAGVPFLFKQWGDWLPCHDEDGLDAGFTVVADDGSNRLIAPGTAFVRHDGQDFARVGKKAAGRLLDGVEHDGMPV